MADKHRAITTQGIPTCLCDGGGSRHQSYCGAHCECCEEHPVGRYRPKDWLRSPTWDRPDQWYDNVARGGIKGFRNMSGQYQEHRGYMNASGKMGVGTSIGLMGLVMIFGMLYLLNRYVEAQPTKG